MNNSKEFKKFATKHLGINSLTLDSYSSMYSNYISPTITEERKMNIPKIRLVDAFRGFLFQKLKFR